MSDGRKVLSPLRYAIIAGVIFSLWIFVTILAVFFFALPFGLIDGLQWKDLNLNLIIAITRNFALYSLIFFPIGFMYGLGSGYARNPHHQNQHFIIVFSGLAFSSIMLVCIAYFFGPDDFHINRDGLIGSSLWIAFLGSLLVCIAYSQKRVALKAQRDRDEK